MTLRVVVLSLLSAARALGSLDQQIDEPIDVMQSSAAAGDLSAQFNLGLCYQRGEKVPRDAALAVQWYRKAALSGFASAQFNLGVMLMNGTDVPRDQKEAAKWIQAAAENGVFEAQLTLIELCTQGRGVPKNPANALTWDMLARRTLEVKLGGSAGAPPRPAKLRSDGAAELIGQDGRREWVLGDGSKETVAGDGTRQLVHPDGSRTTVNKDGTRVTTYSSGITETVTASGLKILRDTKGNVQTTGTDASQTVEGNGKDRFDRVVRIVERFDKNHQSLGRRITRGTITIDEQPGGAQVVRTKVRDETGREMIIVEEIAADGTFTNRKLIRFNNGESPKDGEIWTVRRTLETKDGVAVDVKESYSSDGLSEQEVLAGTERKIVRSTGSTAAEPSAKETASKPPSPESNGVVPLDQLKAKLRDAFASREIVVPANDPPDLMKDVLKEVSVSKIKASEQTGDDSMNFRPKTDLAPMLRKLSDLEIKARNFAGATDQDYDHGTAIAAAYLIPLPGSPQKAKSPPAWMRAQAIMLPEEPLLPRPDDGTKAVPLGYNGRQVIKLQPWKHANTAHFIVHYVDESNARLTMRYLEGVYSMVTTLLNLDPQAAPTPNHVFIFPNESSWEEYTSKLDMPKRVLGFAYKTELLLSAAKDLDKPTGHFGARSAADEARDRPIHTLCHELTHALIARFYPGRSLPLWANEGFAEYIAARTLATKRGQPEQRYLSQQAEKSTSVQKVFDRIKYGAISETPGRLPDPATLFYANSQKCMRVICEKLPADGLPKFFNALMAGNLPGPAFKAVYGNQCDSTDAFQRMVNATP